MVKGQGVWRHTADDETVGFWNKGVKGEHVVTLMFTQRQLIVSAFSDDTFSAMLFII